MFKRLAWSDLPGAISAVVVAAFVLWCLYGCDQVDAEFNWSTAQKTAMPSHELVRPLFIKGVPRHQRYDPEAPQVWPVPLERVP